MILILAIALSAFYDWPIHLFSILTVTNFSLLYITTHEMEGDPYVAQASFQSLFAIYCIVLFMLDSLWIF